LGVISVYVFAYALTAIEVMLRIGEGATFFQQHPKATGIVQRIGGDLASHG
jgi:hypothetical protein